MKKVNQLICYLILSIFFYLAFAVLVFRLDSIPGLGAFLSFGFILPFIMSLVWSVIIYKNRKNIKYSIIFFLAGIAVYSVLGFIMIYLIGLVWASV